MKGGLEFERVNRSSISSESNQHAAFAGRASVPRLPIYRNCRC